MPEAIPVKTPGHLDAFTRAYLECAAWSSSHTYLEEDGSEGETVQIDDVMNDDGAEWAPSAIEHAVADCRDFQEANAELLTQAGSEEQNGHDFWLTRNGHGAGFWDRDYPGTLGDDLSKAAKSYGECDLYVGDDGKVYCS
jgi:hypothetical protein